MRQISATLRLLVCALAVLAACSADTAQEPSAAPSDVLEDTTTPPGDVQADSETPDSQAADVGTDDATPKDVAPEDVPPADAGSGSLDTETTDILEAEDADGATADSATSDAATFTDVAGPDDAEGPAPDIGGDTESDAQAQPSDTSMAEDTVEPMEPAPLPGEVVFSELMPDPSGISDANGEWLELTNAADHAISLAHCTLSDTGSDLVPFTAMEGELVVPPGASWLLAAHADATLNGGLTPDLVYSGVYLSNTADALTLTCGGLLIDSVAYEDGDWPMFPGRSLAFDTTLAYSATTNDAPSAWCASHTLYTVGNYGTPGEANPPCPAPDGDIDACRLIAPQTEEVIVGTPLWIVARVFDEGVTDVNPWVDTHPTLVAQVGYGPVDVDPQASPEAFTWEEAIGTLGWDDLEEPGWDQYDYEWPAPSAGVYQVLARFSLDSGETWQACDLTGSEDGYVSTDAGLVTTGPDPCTENPCVAGPQPTCSDDGTAVVSPITPGSCTAEGLEAVCEYEEEASDCAAQGGACVGGACEGLAPHPDVGEVIFTEVMTNPAGIPEPAGEWFELSATTEDTLNLHGCLLTSGNNEGHAVESESGGLLIQPGQALLFSRSADLEVNGGLTPDYVYASLTLGNVADGLSLVCDDVIVDEIAWAPGLDFPLASGQSMQLDPASYSEAGNDNGAAWCVSSVPYTEENSGTPGAANEVCPIPDPCEGITCESPPPHTCVFGVATTYAPMGTCVDGQCVYSAEATEDCAESGVLCDNGLCTNTPDPCLPNPCTSPPPVACDSDSLVVSAPIGACSVDETTGGPSCSFTVSTIACGALGTTCEDGTCVGVDTQPSPGSVLFVEMMVDPAESAGPDGEWLELLNTGDTWLDLSGCVLGDGVDAAHTLSPDGPLLIGPGQIALLAGNATAPYNGGVTPDYVFGSGFHLDDQEGAAQLHCDGVLIDGVAYDASVWGLQPGVAFQLDSNALDAAANDGANAWCLAHDTFGKGDLGSPGTPNPPCPTANSVDWCRVEAPMLAEVVLVGDEVLATGALREPPLTSVTSGTDTHPWVLVQMAVGPQGSSPEGDAADWTFIDAAPAAAWTAGDDQAGVDKYIAVWTPDAAMNFDLAYRVSVDRGLTWTYCDRDTGLPGEDGSENGYAPGDAISLEVAPSPCDPNPCQATPTSACEGSLQVSTEAVGDCAVVNQQAVCSFPESTLDCAAYAGSCVDGSCVDMATAPTPGQLVITELMIDPVTVPDAQGEWLEFTNVSDSAVLLDGCTLSDTVDGEEHTITPMLPLVAYPGEALVLGRSQDAAANGGVGTDYAFGSDFELANDADSIALRCGGTTIDSVHVDDSFPSTSGASLQLDPAATHAADNDDGSQWCAAYLAYGDGDLGTPGEANPVCPTPTPLGWCRLQWPPSILDVEGVEVTVYGRVYQAGVTDVSNVVDTHPLLRGQLGIGPEGSDPTVDATGWSFVPGHANTGWEDTLEPGNDEYQAILTVPTPGQYDYAFRFTADGGLTWTWCDLDQGTDGGDGSEDGYQVTASGSLYASEGPCDPNPCLSGPASQCNGDVLSAWQVPGVCTSFNGTAECDFVQVVTDCAAAGGYCEEAGCVDIAIAPVAGDLVITEAMIDSDAVGDTKGEWIEFHNVSGHKLDLEGCVIRDDDSDNHVVTTGAPLIVEANALFLVGRNGTSTDNGGFTPDYAGSINLANSQDEIALECDGEVIDHIAYDAGTHPIESGVAMQLDPLALDSVSNDDSASWCAASSPYGDGDLGSPGEPNAECPYVDPCLDITCETPPPAACNGDVLEFPTLTGICEAGLCTYPIATLVACADTGQVCEAGACITPSNPVDWCRLQWPEEITAYPDEGVTVYGRYFEPGLTDLTPAVDESPELTAQILVGPDATDPTVDSTDWVAWPATANPGWSDDEVGVDEVMATVSTAAEGVYDYAMRITVDGGQTWTWCDRQTSPESNGSQDGYQVANAGSWTTVPDPCVPNPCTDAPAPSCDGDMLSSHEALGTCDNSTGSPVCSYPAVVTDCAVDGGTCDAGACDYSVSPGPGELLLTEFMHSPTAVAAAEGAWLEYWNATDLELDISGCELVIGAATYSFPSDAAVLQPGAYLLVAPNQDQATNGGFLADVEIPELSVPTGDATYEVACLGQVVGLFTYEAASWPNTPGASIQVTIEQLGNADVTAWCAGTEPYGLGDLGTPGADNTSCQP